MDDTFWFLDYEYTEEDVEDFRKWVAGLSRYQMCDQWRFCPSTKGGVWFQSDTPLWPIWEARYNELGGMSPSISKSMGWDSRSSGLVWTPPSREN
jgi:hypothetical protein